jgi:DNA-binding MarR family transcriptional regulator
MDALEDDTTRFLTAWLLVRQMVQAANFNRFQRAGLSATQFMTLNVVPKGGMTLTGLARKLNLSTATLNATVNSLEERGLIRRTRNVSDGRKVDICATRSGEAMQNAASKEFHQFMAGLFARMGRRRREGLLLGLEQMVKLSATGDEAPPKPTRRARGAAPAERSTRQSRQR